jgi:hypothetical protein
MASISRRSGFMVGMSLSLAGLPDFICFAAIVQFLTWLQAL